MAAATLAVQVKVAEVNFEGGARKLVLLVESTAAATAVPLSDAAKAPDASRPSGALGMVGKALTLNYDDATGAITSLT